MYAPHDGAVRCAPRRRLHLIAPMSMSATPTARMPSLSIRLDARTIVKLEREAAAERRPVSSLIRNLLDDALRDRERQQARRGSANA
jgi:hypothetical protein